MARRIDRLRTLTHQHVSCAKQHRTRLLRLRLDRHEPHGRSRGRLGNRFGVRCIILLPLDERLHVDRRDKSYRVPKPLDLAPQSWDVAQASIATIQRGWSARNDRNRSRGSFLRKMTEPSAAAPCA